MERIFFDLTGGIAENFETTPGNMVINSINYEKINEGEIQLRTEPSTFSSGLNTKLATDFTTIIKLSSAVYATNLPEDCDYDWYFLAYGVDSGTYKLFLYHHESGGWQSEDLTTKLAEIDVVYTSESNPRFWVSADGVLIADGVNRNHKIFVDRDGVASSRHLGLPAPQYKLDVSHLPQYIQSIETDATIADTGMTVERGLSLQYAYTYTTKDGDESNPSPLHVETTIAGQFFDTENYDVGFKYYWKRLLLSNIQIPENLSTFEQNNLERIKIYRAERKVNDGSEPFGDMVFVFGAGAVYDEEISIGDNSQSSTISMSYENDEAPISRDIAEVNSIIGAIGSKDEVIRKLPVEVDHIWKIKINNPNGQYYTDRAFHFYIDQNDSVWDGDLDVEQAFLDTGGVNRTRFFESDFTTPVPYSFQVMGEDVGSQEIENPTTVGGTNYTLTGNCTVSGGVPISKTAGGTGTFYQTNTVTVVTPGLYKIYIDGVSLLDAGSLYMQIGATVTDTLQLYAGSFRFVSYLYLTAGTYTVTVNCDSASSIKQFSFLSLKAITDYQKVHVYLNPTNVNASGITEIYMTVKDAGWGGTAYSTSYKQGFPSIIANDTVDYQYPFVRSRRRFEGDFLIAPMDNIYKKTDTALALINDNFYSEDYFDFRKQLGTITEDNEPIANWNFFDVRQKIQRNANSNSYSLLFNSTDAEMKVSNMATPEPFSSSEFLTITGHYLGNQANITGTHLLFNSTDSSGDGFALALYNDGSDLNFRLITKDGASVGTSELVIDSIVTDASIDLFYVFSVDINAELAYLYCFYNNNLYKQSYSSFSFPVVEECRFGDDRAGLTTYTACKGYYDQLNVYRNVLVDTIEKAEGLHCTHPYPDVDVIGWNKYDQQTPIFSGAVTGAESATVNGQTWRNVFSFSGDYSSYFQENKGMRIVQKTATPNRYAGVYFIKDVYYDSSGTTTYISVYQPISVGVSIMADLYLITFNNNISVENISDENLDNIIRYTDVNKTSFPDLYYKKSRETNRRIIPAPSFLKFEYQNTFLIFTRNNVERFVLNGQPNELAGDISNLIPENENYGLLDLDSLVMSRDALYWRSEVGVVEWNSSGIRIISNYKLDGQEYSLINIPIDTEVRADYVPQRNQIIFYELTPSYSATNLIWVYDIDEEEWRQYNAIDVLWSINLTRGTEIDNYNLFLTHDGGIDKYPDLSLTPTYASKGSVEKDMEVYYATFDGADYEFEPNGSNDVDATVTVSNKIFGSDKTKTYSDIESFKKYGFPIGWYGNKLKIKIEDAKTVKPVEVTLKQRRSRR